MFHTWLLPRAGLDRSVVRPRPHHPKTPLSLNSRTTSRASKSLVLAGVPPLDAHNLPLEVFGDLVSSGSLPQRRLGEDNQSIAATEGALRCYVVTLLLPSGLVSLRWRENICAAPPLSVTPPQIPVSIGSLPRRGASSRPMGPPDAPPGSRTPLLSFELVFNEVVKAKRSRRYIPPRNVQRLFFHYDDETPRTLIHPHLDLYELQARVFILSHRGAH